MSKEVAKWYALKVHSGAENKVLQELRLALEENEMSEALVDSVIPTFEVDSVRNGKRTTREKRFFSGYVFLKLDFSDKLWYLVKGVQRVVGFAGTRKGVPVPISDAEAQAMLARIDRKVQEAEEFVVGQSVKVKEGPFASLQGVVQSVDLPKKRLRVVVSIFGRATPVELDFSGVEKV